MNSNAWRRRLLGRVVILSGFVASVSGLDGCAYAIRPPSMLDSLVARSQIDTIASRYWAFLRQSSPGLAAEAGAPVSRLPDVTIDGAKDDAQFARLALTVLDDIDVNALTEDSYVSWLTLRWEAEALGGRAAFHWTRLSDLVPGRSVLDDAVAILRAQAGDSVATVRYLGLVNTVPQLLRTLRFETEERVQRGIRMPAAAQQRAAEYVRSLIAPREASAFAIAPSFAPGADTAWRGAVVRASAATIVRDINPQLDTLARFLEVSLAPATQGIGLSAIPGGAQHYANLLRFHSTLDIGADTAHGIGLRETARLASLADAARRVAGLPANRDSLRAALLRDSSFALSERQLLPETVLHLYESLRAGVGSLFPLQPGVQLSIGLLPPERESLAGLTTYEAPTASHEARYRLNAQRLRELGALSLPAILIADLAPGRHWQQSVQRENDSLPMFRRLGFHAGFVNGWSAYVLTVADSALALTPAQRYGIRLRALADACGLVVDTGIHALGWSHDDALRFLRQYLPYPDEELERSYVIEAIEAPGTLSAAALGARELMGLRAWVARELGPAFSLPAFHREILRLGSVPLPVLGTHLERWIWEQRNAAMVPR